MDLEYGWRHPSCAEEDISKQTAAAEASLVNTCPYQRDDSQSATYRSFAHTSPCIINYLVHIVLRSSKTHRGALWKLIYIFIL